VKENARWTSGRKGWIFRWRILEWYEVSSFPRKFISFQFSRPGRSYHDINEEIIWASILMASMIAMLIILALCYIGYEKCQRKREYLINA
jgi:hypothetical protein